MPELEIEMHNNYIKDLDDEGQRVLLRSFNRENLSYEIDRRDVLNRESLKAVQQLTNFEVK